MLVLHVWLLLLPSLLLLPALPLRPLPRLVQTLSFVSRIHVEYDARRVVADFDVVQRVDRAAKLHHVELWGKARGWWGRLAPLLLRLLPTWWPTTWRPKPCAKAGVRTYTTPMTSGLRDALTANDVNDDGIAGSVGILVYMWVHPTLRGQRLGDYLLSTCCLKLQQLNACHMLLVHDDNGSNKLIDYYAQRGFAPVFSFLDKGMVGRL